MDAINGIRGVDENGEYEKSYPYAAGYAQSVMVDVVHDLRGIRKYLMEE